MQKWDVGPGYVDSRTATVLLSDSDLKHILITIHMI